MAIKISGTTVIDQSKQIQNVVGYYGDGVATQAEAEAGTNNNQLMTPLRVKQAVEAAGGSVVKRIQRFTKSYSGEATYDTTITSVSTGKTFLTVSDSQILVTSTSSSQSSSQTKTSQINNTGAGINYAVGFGYGYGFGYGFGFGFGYGGGARAELTSGSNVRVTSTGGSGVIAIEVIEFN
jgi:hypothetical protein